MKRTLALILTVMMVLCMIPASLLSVLANGPGVGTTGPANLSFQAANKTEIPKTVNVDGVLNDTGWDVDGWHEVNSATGTWDVGTPRNNNFEYEYQLHRNETFLYGAYSINLDSIFNGKLDSITVWLNDGSVSDKYTQKIVVSAIDGENGTATMKVTDAAGKDITNDVVRNSSPTQANDYYTASEASQITAKMTEIDGVNFVVVEFRYRMDNVSEDFRLNGKITAFSQVTLSGTPAESLYFPRLATTADRIFGDSPEAAWPENAHEITQSDVRNDDGMADYNNVLPTDINIDGRFTEGTWVNLTDRYSAKNQDGAGYSIDDYRRAENYDNGYVANIADVKYSGTVANGSTVKGSSYDSTPYALPTLPYDYLRFKYNAGINMDTAGGCLFAGAVVAFADGMKWQAENLYCYVMINAGGTKSTLKIKLDGKKAQSGAETQFESSFYNHTAGKAGPADKTYGAAKRQTYSRYLVNFEFSIPFSQCIPDTNGDGKYNLDDIGTGWTYLIEISNKDNSITGSDYNRNHTGYYANSSVGNGWASFPADVARHYNDSAMDGDLSRDTWANLIAADSYIDGMSGYKGSSSQIDNIRRGMNYYYEVYADYDYVYGAVIINAWEGWADSATNTDADAFTLWVYNNTVVDQQHYNFAISFYNTANSKNTFDGTKTGWDVSAWYKNAPSNSPLKDAKSDRANKYTKGDKEIAGIEAVMRRIDASGATENSQYGVKKGEDDYYESKGAGLVLEFKIPVSLLFYDQSAGADAYSPAVAFGYYTSVSKGGISVINDYGNFKAENPVIAHPMANNHGAGLDCYWDDYNASPLYTYDYTNVNDKGDIPYQTHYLPDGEIWIGPDVSGKTRSDYMDAGKISYEVNDRVFDPKRIYADTCRQIRSDDSNDGWRFGRVIDNFKPEGRLEEVYWNEEDELIKVNGETGYWDNLPTGNNEFDYGYRVYTGREYVYGAVKVNATSIKELEFIDDLTGDERTAAIARNNAILAENAKIIENTKINVWFNSAENTSGNTNATHRFTFWLENSYVAKCEAVDLVNGLDLPLSGTVLEENFATSGTEEKYVIYEMKTINNDIVVEFMIDLDLLNMNNDTVGKMDYARDGYEYVVGVTHPVDGENLSLYHLDDTKTFWMTGFGDSEAYGYSAGIVIPGLLANTDSATVNKAIGNINDHAIVVFFEKTEYDGVYEVVYYNDNRGEGSHDFQYVYGNSGKGISADGFMYILNEGHIPANHSQARPVEVSNNMSSFANYAAIAARTDFKQGALIKFENLVLDPKSLEYTKNEATYTYCGIGNYRENDTKFPYDVIDGKPNPNHANAHLEQNDTGYISVPQYSIFTAKGNVLDKTPENSWGTAAPALEVSYLSDFIIEKIEIDGLLDDQGWISADWISVNEDANGNRQTVAHTSGKRLPDGSYSNEFKIYEYAVRTDGEYFYVAGRIYMPMDGMRDSNGDGIGDEKMLDAGGKIVSPTWRLWVNDTTGNGMSSYDKLFDIEGGLTKTLNFDFSQYDIDSRTNYYAPEAIVKPPVHYVGDDDASVTYNGGTGAVSLTFNNYNLRVSEITPNHKYNPNAGSGDGHYTLVGESGAAKTDLGYRESSFYGETVVVEENAYSGGDYDDLTDDDAWVAERHLKSITYGSEHATMREDPNNHNVTLVEYKIKLDELDMNNDGTFEYGFHASTLGHSDSGNDYVFFYPQVVKEVGQDISKYDRFHMPMWFWSNTSLVYNDAFAADIMLKSTYTPVTEIGSELYLVNAEEEGYKPYPSSTYGETSAILLGAYYDHDYISRFMRDNGIYNAPDWDYWDVYEMGILVFPPHGMNENGTQVDHNEFLNVTAEDRYYKINGKGVVNVEADLIRNHQGEGSRFCDYENFVFYTAMVLSPAQVESGSYYAYKNLKYSYRGYVDFYGNDLYNDEFEGWPSEMDPFLQYYYNQDELYVEDTFIDGVRNDIYVNDIHNTKDTWNALIGNGFEFGGVGFDADKATEMKDLPEGSDITTKLPNLAKLTEEELEKYGLDASNLPDVTDIDAVPLGKSYSDSADGKFTLKRFSLADKALYNDYYSSAMIRSMEIVKEIAARKADEADTNANRVAHDNVDVYYVPATNDPISKERVEYLAESAGYGITDVNDNAVRAVVYIDGSTNTVESVKELAKTADVVATTTDAATATELESAGVATVFNSNKDVLGMLGMAKLVTMVYGNVNVDVDYYGTKGDVTTAKNTVNGLLDSIGIKQHSVANSLDILVLATSDTGNADYNDNLLAKLADNLAANVPTVVIDMTENNGLTYADKYVTPITETMHLGRLLGYSSMPNATEAAAIAIAQGVARYSFLSGVKTVSADSNQAFLKSLTYSLVNDIAFNEKYDPKNVPATLDGSTTAPKVGAFQIEAEKISNQINGSGILVWIDAEDGNESENADACVLVGYLEGSDISNAVISGDEARFEIILTSGVNIARQNYSVGKSGATVSKTFGTSSWNYTEETIVNPNNTVQAYTPSVDTTTAKNNDAKYLLDGETTTKVWDFLLPDALEYNSSYDFTGTAGANTVPGIEHTNLYLSNAQAAGRLNVKRGLATANRWIAIGNEGTVTITLNEANSNLAAIRVHLGASSNANASKPALLLSYSTGGEYISYGEGTDGRILTVESSGSKNFTYWATLDLTGLQGKGVKSIKLTLKRNNSVVSLIDEIEVYTAPSTTKSATTLQVGTFNVGHCENINSGSGTAFGMYYTSGDNVAGGTIKWANYSNANTTVADVQNVGKFIKNSAGTSYDVMFIQEAAQYFGSNGGSHIWGNCNQMKILSDYSGYEYYTYARGDKNPNYMHGAEALITDDTTTMLDDPSVGVGVLSKYPVVASGSYIQQNGQVIAWARIFVEGQYIDVFSTHFDSNQYRTYDKYMMRHKLYQGLKRVVENTDAFIIGGDFNEVYLNTFQVAGEDAWTPVLDMRAYVDYQGEPWYELSGKDTYVEHTQIAALKDNVNEYYMGVIKTANPSGTTDSVVYNNLYTLSRHRKIVDNIMFGGDFAEQGYQTLATDWSSSDQIGGTNGIKAKTYEPTTVDYDPSTSGTQTFGDTDHRMLCYSFNIKVPTTTP